MDKRARFLRLLEACEALTVDETAAIREENFSQVLEVQERKMAVLAALNSAAPALDSAAPGASGLRLRIGTLIEAERSNATAIGHSLERARSVRRTVASGRRRLTDLRHAYGGALRRPDTGALSAQG